MATKFIGVGLANDRKPGDVPAIPDVGLVLVSVLSEGVLLPEWGSFPSTFAFEYIELGDGPFPAGGFLRVSAAANRVLVGKGDNTSTDLDLVYWDGHDLLFGSSVADGVTAIITHAKTGGFFTWNLGGVYLYGADSAGLDLNSHSIRNVTTLNGVTLANVVEGTALTNADQTLNVSGGNNYVQSVALTDNRTKTLGTSGSPIAGEIMTIILTGDAAASTPNFIVVNGGTGGGTLITIAETACVMDFQFDGTDWALAGLKRLQG